MNILHTVEFYSPSVGGAQEVVRQISERLVRRGHTVTVATSSLAERSARVLNGVRIEEFEISGNAVSGFQGETKRYQDFLMGGKFDIMMNYAAQEWSADLAFEVLGKMHSRKVFTPCGFSALYNPAYSNYFSEIPGIMRQYDHLIFHAGRYRDVEFARQHRLSNYSIIPNGAARDEFEIIDSTFRRRHGIPENIPLILTVGSHTRLKGHRLSIETLRRLKTKRAALVIIGNVLSGKNCFEDCRVRAQRANWAGLGLKRVYLLNPPRPDVVAAYHAADLFLFASNVEYSPIVLFESLAAHTPFISLACGNAAEIAEWTGGGLIAPTHEIKEGVVEGDSESLAKLVDELLNNPEKRFALAEAGHRAWQSHYTWETITLEYEQLYEHLLERKV